MAHCVALAHSDSEEGRLGDEEGRTDGNEQGGSGSIHAACKGADGDIIQP